MDRSTASALRNVYLLAFDDFATDPMDAARLANVKNTRYARELLGVLVGADLLVVSDVNGEGDVWQVCNPGTTDDSTRVEAVAVIDAWLASVEGVEVVEPKPIPKSVSGLTPCLCGCGVQVAGKSLYRPGHDARHASQVAQAISVAGSDAEYRALLAELPTVALKAKAVAQADRIRTKQDSKVRATPAVKAPVEVEAAPVAVSGTVKIGRWVYDAEMVPGADSLRYRKDASATWKGTSKAREVAAFSPLV